MRSLKESTRAVLRSGVKCIPFSMLAAYGNPVLTYHACFDTLPDDVSALDNILPGDLYSQLAELKRHFRFVSIDELIESRNRQGLAAVTFDDGYKNVIDSAFPILKALEIPFTIFLTTHPFDGKIFWRHKVTHIVNKGLDKECATSLRGVRAVPGESFYTYLKNPINNSAAAVEEIDAFLERKAIVLPSHTHLIDDEKYLISHPLVSYGNHTYSHYVLASLSAEQQYAEISAAKRFLECRPGLQISSAFSLPFGGEEQMNEDTLEAVRQLGYKAILLNRNHINPGKFRELAGLRIVERFSPAAGSATLQVKKNTLNSVLARGLRKRVRNGTGKSHGLRILELIDSLDTGGAERMTSTLALEMRARGHQVHVMCLRDLGVMAVPQERFAEAGVPVLALRKPEGFSPSTARRIAAYVRDHGIQVVHSHNPQVNHYGVAAARIGGAAAVNTVHGIQTLHLSRLARAIYIASCRASARVICVSEAVRRAFLREVLNQADLAAVIENGIDLAPLLQVSRQPRDGTFVIGTTGRLVEVKGHRILLDAFQAVVRDYPNCRLEFLGWGELEEPLRQQSGDLGIAEKTVFHGWSSDIAAYLSRLDLFVLPSLSEGLPLTLLEAMAAGVPVVASEVGGIPDIVRRSGAGWLCPAGNSKALAEALLTAIRDGGLEQRGLLGRADVVKHHSLAQMTDQYLALFEDLVRNKVERQSARQW